MKKTVKVVDTILRDAPQSLIATRMTTAQMEPVLDLLDQAGYYALECWGGATFDTCMRFLNEDPWERLRTIRKHLKHTKTQMLLRGQNVLGYKNYPDDFVEAFVAKSIDNGIDIIRIFDALNDTRNLETAMKATKKYGGHAQPALCYTTGPVFTLDYFAKLAKELEEMGADSIAIKDMAGILTPQATYDLVSAMKKKSKLPIEIHSHTTAGTGSMNVLKAVEASCDIIDTALSPLGGGTSHPATETMHITLTGMGYETGLKLDVLQELAGYFTKLRDQYAQEGLLKMKMLEVEPKALIYQVPGGMLSNLLSQMTEAGKADKYYEVLAEVPRVREDLGYPPLVTPMSQMVGTQAMMNVIFGERYKQVPKEIKDYVRGLYGRTPAPISEAMRKKIIGDEPVMTDRPADHLEPGLPRFREEIGDLAESEEDVLSYGSFPQVAKKFLQKRADPWFDVPVQEVEVEFDGQFS